MKDCSSSFVPPDPEIFVSLRKLPGIHHPRFHDLARPMPSQCRPSVPHLFQSLTKMNRP